MKIELTKEKAEAIISSCVTCDHFETAIVYIELFYKKFGDIDIYNELICLHNNKFDELRCSK